MVLARSAGEQVNELSSLHPSSQVLEALLDLMDVDGDDQIIYKEFARVCAPGSTSVSMLARQPRALLTSLSMSLRVLSSTPRPLCVCVRHCCLPRLGANASADPHRISST